MVYEILPYVFNRDKFAINDIAKLLDSNRSNIDAIKMLKPFSLKTFATTNHAEQPAETDLSMDISLALEQARKAFVAAS